MRAQRETLTREPIAAIPVAHFATVKTIDPPLRSLIGQRFEVIGRRAKRLLFRAEDENTLMVHLMSAGKLALAQKHTRSAVLVVGFESGTELVMTEGGSKRRAGAWLLITAGAGTGTRPHRPRAARSLVHCRRARPSRPGAPPPAARVPARPARDRRHRPGLCQRDPAGSHALAQHPLGQARPGRAGAAAHRDRRRAGRGRGAAGAALDQGPHHQGRPRLRGARSRGGAVPALRRSNPNGVVRRIHGVLLRHLPDRRAGAGRPAACRVFCATDLPSR